MSNVKSSTLRVIIENVYSAKDHANGIQILMAHLEKPDCPIRSLEASGIVMRAKQCPTLLALQKYLTNSWFKYEGLSCTRRERY